MNPLQSDISSESPQTIKVGDTAPNFKVKNQKGEEVHLYSHLEQGQKVLLVFYPKDMTPGCTVQLCGIRDVYAEFNQYGITVLGVNKGSEKSHQNFINTFNLPFDILVDEHNTIRDSYGAVKKFFSNLTVKRGVVLIDTNKKVLYTFWGQQDNSKILALFKS